VALLIADVLATVARCAAPIPEGKTTMDHTRFLRLFAVAATLAGGFGFAATASAASDNSHTPVTLCHWVPANGGSYVVITVDDDASTANPSGQGHMSHADDIIPANPDGICGTPDPD
jgi:hypothetical protein